MSRPILKIAVTRLEDREFIISNNTLQVDLANKIIKVSHHIYLTYKIML